MNLVIQRVQKASVVADGVLSGECSRGLMILVGVADGDTREDAELLARKAANLRIFTDSEDKMNLSVKDIDGEALIVSNFTLLANYKRGNRPDYMGAAKPQTANELYEYFVSLMRAELRSVATGVFGAHMEINMCADGPVTIVMESEALKKK